MSRFCVRAWAWWRRPPPVGTILRRNSLARRCISGQAFVSAYSAAKFGLEG